MVRLADDRTPQAGRGSESRTLAVPAVNSLFVCAPEAQECWDHALPGPRGLEAADQALALRTRASTPSPSVVIFFLPSGDNTINLSSVSLQLDRVSLSHLCLSPWHIPQLAHRRHPPSVPPVMLLQDSQSPAFQAHLRCDRPTAGCRLISAPVSWLPL